MICTIFLSNRNQQAVHALQKFHRLFRGDMTVYTYCSRLKIIVADTLRDVGDPISDPVQSRHEADSLMWEGLRSRSSPDQSRKFFALYTFSFFLFSYCTGARLWLRREE
jgi:hypothetical protein